MGGSEFDTDAEWLTQRYVEVGLQEWVLLPPTRHFRDVLVARGYAPIYREYNSSHDTLCAGWR